ncbi:NAD-dependent protein deacetylase, SIR2 family [Psychroflexus torquis ATCC 700755]|uniref:NAD-dependent protein deacylase n=1 Tax=Psychroflexus torquis (strain ATCC 700755 / CIP 106069 / ACAM 623) TaxID=313595 RepID=K4IHS6_PSYTT|nr:NAD-dependent deacylase [Psychroflexus torquis]AFU70082.1 NAD-dependent protein deacetylase, SIR2 family [Psychroflexus torquis ATCC 700755]
MKHISILTGAGISAESGVKTFRDHDGLWEGHDVMQVATPQAFEKNPSLVLDFYNKRRQQLLAVQPNLAHQRLVDLETKFKVDIITQNVDDLHERAGSSQVTHLHGELMKVRSTFDHHLIYNWKKDLNLGDFCEHHHQLRPHVVWFGEAVPMMEKAIDILKQTDLLIIIGTSMQVYPAAGLIDFAPSSTPIYFIDPNPSISESTDVHIYAEKATTGVDKLVRKLLA